ncbi:nitroreductase family protein [Chloroflexota bacterium]
MNIDELLELMKTRRSVRRFKPDPVPDECITKMIEAARWAPSGANGQPWEFIVIKDAETKQKMADAYRQVRPEHYYIEQTRVEGVKHNALSSQVNEPHFQNAPVLIMVCADKRAYQASVMAGSLIGTGGGSGDATFQKSVSNATFSLHLAARAMELGSQWHSILADWEQLLKPILGVPIYLQIHTMVPVGYPDYEPPKPYRRSAEEITHYEKYDMSRFRTGDKIVEFIRNLRGRTKTAYEAWVKPDLDH